MHSPHSAEPGVPGSPEYGLPNNQAYLDELQAFWGTHPSPISPEAAQRASKLVIDSITVRPQGRYSRYLIADALLSPNSGLTITEFAHLAPDPETSAGRVNNTHASMNKAHRDLLEAAGITLPAIPPSEATRFVYNFATIALNTLCTIVHAHAEEMQLPGHEALVFGTIDRTTSSQGPGPWSMDHDAIRRLDAFLANPELRQRVVQTLQAEKAEMEAECGTPYEHQRRFIQDYMQRRSVQMQPSAPAQPIDQA